MSDQVLVIALPAIGTFATRFAGVVIDQYLPEQGP